MGNAGAIKDVSLFVGAFGERSGGGGGAAGSKKVFPSRMAGGGGKTGDSTATTKGWRW